MILPNSVLASLGELVRGWNSEYFESQLISAANYQVVLDWELQDLQRLTALGISQENISGAITARLELLKLVAYHDPNQVSLPNALANLWHLTLPLALQLVNSRKRQNSPLIQGIVGVQGSGKSTLAQSLKVLIELLGLSCLAFSLDDLYKTHSDRLKLQAIDPKLIWRGIPGTHDLDLGIDILQRLSQAKATEIPRFDKSAFGGAGDRLGYESVAPVDIVIFEGWFVGMRSLPEAAILGHRSNDPDFDQDFALDMNRALESYFPLWQLLDRLIVLYANDYSWSLDWRKGAERKMAKSGKLGMSDRQVEEFVKYFWRALPPQPYFDYLLHQDYVDLVIKIDRDRHFGAIY